MPSPLDPEVISGDTGPSPPVAMSDAAMIDVDATAQRGAGGLTTTGLDGIHRDNGQPPLFHEAAAREDNTGDHENIIERKTDPSTVINVPMPADATAAAANTAVAASHDEGEAAARPPLATSHDGDKEAARPVDREQLSLTTISQRETSATGNNHGWRPPLLGELEQQTPGAFRVPATAPPPPQTVSSLSSNE